VSRGTFHKKGGVMGEIKTFYGGKGYVLLKPTKAGLLVTASGKRNKMLELAKKHNWAVGKLEAIRYVKP